MTTQPPPRPSYLTPHEVAAILRVSAMTVYRLIHGRELEAIRVGRSFRVDTRDVRAFLRDASTTADLPVGAA